jgi:hypothetical protein
LSTLQNFAAAQLASGFLLSLHRIQNAGRAWTITEAFRSAILLLRAHKTFAFGSFLRTNTELTPRNSRSRYQQSEYEEFKHYPTKFCHESSPFVVVKDIFKRLSFAHAPAQG